MADCPNSSRDCYAACEAANQYGLSGPEYDAPRTVRLRFAPTRTRLHQVVLHDTAFRIGPDGFAPLLDVASLRLPKADETPIRILFDGEPPFLLSPVWDPEEFHLLEDEPLPAREKLELVYRQRRERIEAMLAVHPQVDGVDPERRRAQMRFFCELDRQTVPLLQDAWLKLAIERLSVRLRQRTIERAAACLRGRRFRGQPSLDRALRRSALDVSRLVCGLLAPLTEPGNAFGDLDECFEAFACGDLAMGRIPDTEDTIQCHGGPNGAQFFSFAEAALYFLEHDTDDERRRIWRGALPTFVRTAEIFVQLYWSGACRTFGSYGYYWRGQNGFSAEHRRRLRRAHAALRCVDALRRRFDFICSYALRDEALLRQEPTCPI